MTIKVGDKLPSVTLTEATAEGPKPVKTDDFFRGKRVALFAVPGAFTPTCSAKHLPGYVEKFAEFKQRGVDVACLAVNDAYVMGAWAKDQHVPDGLMMLADGNGTFTKALGMEMDGTPFGLGIRGKRFGLYADDGVVKALNVEAPGAFEVSSADHMLGLL